MTPNAIDVTLGTFTEKVIEASRKLPVLIDFWAEWCGPCRALTPVLERLAEEYGGRFILARVNSDENQPLAQKFGVRGIPNVKAVVNGEIVDEFTGALPEAKVRAFIDRLLPSRAEPLRVHAMEARARGDTQAARQLLLEALDADPKLEAARLDLAELCLDAGELDPATDQLETLRLPVRDGIRLESLQARLQLARDDGAKPDPVELDAALQGDPGNHPARLQLANALARSGDYRAALEHLLELVRRDRKWRDEAARKAMLTLFNLLAAQPQFDTLVREFRVALARTLN